MDFLKIPLRTHVVDGEGGKKQIQIHLNGRLSSVLEWDPADNMVISLPIPPAPTDIERKPMLPLETKNGPGDF